MFQTRRKPRGGNESNPGYPRVSAGIETPMDHTHLAWEFAELFADLGNDEINELLAKNVPLETLQFFEKYGDDFGRNAGVGGEALRRLPNLMLMGYLLRVLEERILDPDLAPDS